MSSVSSMRPIPRRTDSVPASITNPADTFSFVSARASPTSRRLSPKAFSLRGERTTWNCFSSPPMGVTCETPGTESRRRRTSVRAVARRVIGS